MSKAIIVQIGRLDRNIEEDIHYIYDNKSFHYPLSSFAFKEYLKANENKETKVILLYPVSLPLNSELQNAKCKKEDYQNFLDMIVPMLQNKNKIDDYLKNPEEFLSKHPHNTYADDFLVLHSNGNYLGKGLEAKLHNIVLHIWTYLINIYLREDFDEIYIDISSGLNFYVSGLMEALRYFIVWSGLYNLGNKEKKVKGWISYTDPIIGTQKDKCHIYTYPVNYKSFFTSPITHTEIENGLPKGVVEECLGLARSIKSKVKDYLESFLILFSCFYNAAPLYLFTNTFPSTEEIKGLMSTILDNILSKYKENWCSSPAFEFSDFSKVLLSFGFSYGLKKIIEENKIGEGQNATLKKLQMIGNILKTLGLQTQSSLLEVELHNNFENKDFKAKLNSNDTANDWKYLKEFLKYEQSNEEELSERNFFAHAGFERNITLIKREENDILVTYDQNRLNEVRKILLKRVI